MKEMVKWLVSNELRASNIYHDLAELFRDDEVLYGFLNNLSNEEAGHYELMSQAARLLSTREFESAVLILGDDTRNMVETYFSSCERGIKSGKISRKDLFESIISIEFSEWNSLFLYVVNLLKLIEPRYSDGIKQIQQHKSEIEHFMAAQPDAVGLIDRFKMFPAIWEENILVVDDEDMITMSLQMILEDEGQVDTASNGSDALLKISKNNYGAILTDVRMPLLNGIEFYKKAVELHPELKERFLFLTATGDDNYLEYFRKNNLRYLGKPTDIKLIRKAVEEILGR